MAAEKQFEANRRNAVKSTGPKTEAGKAMTKLNAVSHGLLSAEMILKDEDRGAFEQLRARFQERLKPEGELEDLLVDRVAAGAWRLRRLMRVEADIFEDDRYDHDDNDKGPGWSFIYRGLSRNGDIFSKLSRYETSVERGMYKALHELQRLQASRRGDEVPPPVAVDVNVTGLAGDDGAAD